jgi:hypothetical protein
MIGCNRTMYIVTALAAISLLAGAGCAEERHIGWDRERQVIGPVPLKSGVAYVDSARDLVVVVDVSADVPRVHRYPIGRRAIYAVATPDREHLAVITRGEEAVVKGQIDEVPHLWLIDASAPDTTPVSYPVGSPFDRLAIAGDGSVAVAYFSAAGADSEGFFRNPNELAVIDLHRPPGADNPTIKTVRSFGSVPEGVVLSPPMVIPGSGDPTPRVFAFVLALSNLTMLDATYPERHEVTIRLDQAGAAVRPREMVFAPGSATAYLRSDNARDVLEIIINADPPVGNDVLQNDYRPALAELGAGGGPADIAVYDDPEGRRLILAATPSTREIAVIDADTAGFTTIDTPDPIDRILLFPAGGAVPPRVALLASIGARLPRVHLLRLDGITDELRLVDLDTVVLDKPVLDVVPVPGRALGMIVHDDHRTVLGLLDVIFGSVSPLQGVGRLDSYDFSPEGRYLIGVTSGVARVGVLDLDNLHPSDMRLDDLPTRVFALPNGRVYVEHGGSAGRATILPTAGASRAQSVVLTGFLLSDLFSQEF